MTRQTFALCSALLLSAGVGTPGIAQHESENVAAFARLFGVARWFYPSDAAASLDWNRFAVDGVRRVRTARTPAMLQSTLEELFTPLGPGIAIGMSLPPAAPSGARDRRLVAWHYRGAAVHNVPGAYSARRMNRVTAVQTTAATPAILSQQIDAEPWRGGSIRMRARVRVADAGDMGWAGLWLRVDRVDQSPGFFDNMDDRPVRDTAWREYQIEGPIATNADRIVFGALMTGAMTVDVDAVELFVRGREGDWTPVTVEDAGFEAPASSASGWRSMPSAAFSRQRAGAADGSQFLRIAPAAASASAAFPAVPVDSFETPLAGATATVELTRGLRARVPLSLTDAEARTEGPGLAALRSSIEAVDKPAGRSDDNVRLADVVVAWSALRHFYPYWEDVRVDWDARLVPLLVAALGVADARDAHRDVLRQLVADLQDGHGNVSDITTPTSMAALPLQFRLLDGQLIVTGSSMAQIPIGSVVHAIDGEAAALRIAQEMQRASGSTQWRTSQVASAMRLCRRGSAVSLSFETPRGEGGEASMPCGAPATRAAEPRPDSIAELQPGIWYVDITRVRQAQLRPMLTTLSTARGVIFDVRGYPTDAGSALLPHLMREAEAPDHRWMHIARMARPFGEVAAWQSLSWNVRPAPPYIGAPRVFLTDGRAISYAESVMGYVHEHALGTIVGSATAGANGNVATFMVPGGFSIAFTGMRVTRHDGTTPFHMRGVQPDVPLEPTAAGIRAGRDELLERALSLLR